MPGTYLFLVAISIPIFILGIAFFSERKKADKAAQSLNKFQKDNQNLQSIIKEAQESPVPGKTLENVIDSLCHNLSKTYPHSVLASIILKDEKMIFNASVKEPVNRAFIDHTKDNIRRLLTNTEKHQVRIEENIMGLPVDDLSTSAILSSFDLKFTIKNEVKAVINLSSSVPNLYTPEDARVLNSISDILSSFLNKIESLIRIEKDKAVSMIDSFSEGIIMIDKNKNLVAINDAAIHFLNIRSEVPSFSDVLLSLPNIYNFEDKINTCIGLNQQIIEEDVPMIDKSFRITMTPVLELDTQEKNVIGVSFLLKDTTLEKSLKHMKEDFTNIMVHELRSPITAIKASSEFLQSRGDFTESEKKQLMNMISESSKKMLDKIALILDSAKMDAGLFSIKKTPSDLKKLISDRIEVFAPVATEKAINLKTDIDPSIPNFPFDPVRIDEVVNNLLSNSLKFTPSRGTIQLKAVQADGMIKVSVTDNGEGIAKDKQSLLFSKYQQAPADGQHQGTGLGLYVVKGVVKAHGGNVTLDSIEGKGTTISFSLPINSMSSNLTTLPSAPKPTNPMAN